MLSLAQARRRYLTVDYRKSLERVSLDALYYIYHYEQEGDCIFFATILSTYRPTGPRPLTTMGEDRGQSRNCTPPEWDSPSWLPDMSTPRLFCAYLASINTGNKTERIAWTESHCLGQLRQMLSFTGRCLGTVVMAEGFPPTWKDAAQTITAFLEQAAFSSKQDGKSGLVFENGIEGPVNVALNAILGHPWAYKTDYTGGTGHHESGLGSHSSAAA